ncbi:MAG: HPr family phosphocarrier protein [Succinivibrionaceae bacterium]|nr:HPr family phosphocarrier protein [Succinivibrionaceae bacterium]
MLELTHTISDPRGMHARPAGRLVRLLGQFSSSATINFGKERAAGRNLLALMKLSLQCGDTFTIELEGPDEAAAAEAARRFLEETL